MRYKINFATYDREKVLRRRNIKLLVSVCILLLFTVFLMGLNRASTLSTELNELKKKKDELTLKKEQLLKERRKLFSDSEILLLEAKLNFYKNTFLNRLYTTAFLNNIEEKTASGIFLKSVDFDAGRKQFIITGESLNPEAVASYIMSLQTINYVKKVEITRQTFQRLGEKKLLVSEFELKGEIF